MATHRMDVSVRFGAPDPLETKVEAAEVPLLRVPDVRLWSEMSAIAAFARAGLVPGQRNPRPRPACGTPEVVIRTYPRGGTLVRRGTRVDYELLPGVPRERTTAGSDVARHDSDKLGRSSRRLPEEGA